MTEIPIVKGASGLTGRPQIARFHDLVEEVQPAAPSKTIPPSCLRVLSLPEGHVNASCQANCPGLQSDGSCLCEIVRAAQEQGLDWQFEVEVDQWGNQFWTYCGEL